jgi:hypothetical protein
MGLSVNQRVIHQAKILTDQEMILLPMQCSERSTVQQCTKEGKQQEGSFLQLYVYLSNNFSLFN